MRGDGAYLETEDGRRLVDWVQSWGPLIFGHADPIGQDESVYRTCAEQIWQDLETFVRDLTA